MNSKQIALNLKSFDKTKAILFGIPFSIFVLWRILGGGTLDPEGILRNLKSELISDYTSAVHHDAVSNNEFDEEYWEKGSPTNVEVEFDDVSVAAPILSWSANEDVVIRVDYRLFVAGELIEEVDNRYYLVTRGGATNFFETNWVSYLIHSIV